MFTPSVCLIGLSVHASWQAISVFGYEARQFKQDREEPQAVRLREKA